MQPAPLPNRIVAVDTLRGVAVLGVLLVNIIGFGLPWAAFNNPSAYGGDTGPNLAFWWAQIVLFDGKMRAIFSMLFGASVVLMTGRNEERGLGIQVADLYYRRTLWLIAFGVLHAYLVSNSDILFAYGVVGLALFPLRHVRPSQLLIAGVAVLGFLSLKGLRQAQVDYRLETAASEAEAAQYRGEPLGPRQREARQMWLSREQGMHLVPDTAAIRANIDRERSGYVTLLRWRLGTVPHSQSRGLYDHDIYDVGGMMLIGMGLAMLGVLTGTRSTRFYVGLMGAGYAIGIPIAAAVAWVIARGAFQSPAGEDALHATEDFTRLAVALGHIGLLMVGIRRAWLPRLAARLTAAGQMALTNYLMSSILCSLFFCGYGLGMFGRLQRYQLLYVVVAVWVLILMWSPWWLRRFRYGPAEWVWRSLTRWERQPMRRAA